MPQRLCSKNSEQLPVVTRLTDIFAVGKFDYSVMVPYQNLTRKPELFQAPPGPGYDVPPEPPLAGPDCDALVHICDCETATCLMQIAKSSLNLGCKKWGLD